MNDNLAQNRLVSLLAGKKARGQKTLLPFITAGYPDLAATEALLHEFERRCVEVCELGVPYSDPMADGPVIQASYTHALAGGVTTAGIFDTVRRYRQSGGKIALVAMVSYSIVFRQEPLHYIQQAAEAGIDGLIVPDLPLEEAKSFSAVAQSHGLANVMLVAPTTSPDRRLEIAAQSRGFIYFISVAGITGERDSLPQQTIEAVADLRTQIDTPVCVGFGIAKPAMVKTVCQVADGAIVGSAIVHRITDALKRGTPRDQMLGEVGDFVSELLAPTK